ncbi:hypothetical protein LP421_05365 [Rhizobium sp. RCAM05350]|nr:hypothetical protein LP421_05365 [Rhizobium sp. RCAM05350]
MRVFRPLGTMLDGHDLPLRRTIGPELVGPKRTPVGDPNSGLPKWQDNIYIALSGLGIDPSTYFRLPANRIVEIGEQVTI